MLAGAGMDLMTRAVWDPRYAGLMFVMWWTMMIAMMLPSATPMILIFVKMNRKQGEAKAPYALTAVFASAYLVAWAGFSIAAVATQWVLEATGLLSSMLRSTDRTLGGGLLLVAGIYQFTPLKHTCLRHCRSPLSFILTRWRGGPAGAFRMGVEHGVFCIGCCWFLMALLFFGGVMNLYWIAGLALFVLVEKTVPAGHWLANIVGVGLIIWGILTLAGIAS